MSSAGCPVSYVLSSALLIHEWIFSCLTGTTGVAGFSVPDAIQNLRISRRLERYTYIINTGHCPWQASAAANGIFLTSKPRLI